MKIWIWILAALVLIAILLGIFITIARKGRSLRKNQPKPPVATKGFLQSRESTGKIEITTPFYFGKHPDCNVVLSGSKALYEACIFYHDQRFAVQTLDGAGEVLLNGEEAVAGYLWDGDQLTVAEQNFTFYCY